MIPVPLAATPWRTAGRLAAGFLLGVVLWLAFRSGYERMLAGGAESILRLTESPAVSRLEASGGEIIVNRSDFPPAAPRPGLPAADLHFNFVLLVALFGLSRRPWRGDWVASFLLASVLLWVVHLGALVFQVRALYATRLGEWSAAHYGPVARNFWATGFHFYQVAGRFAAPFALWWPFARIDQTSQAAAPERTRPRRRAGGGSLRIVK